MKNQRAVSWLVEYKGVMFDSVEEGGETLVNIENSDGVHLTIGETQSLLLAALSNLGPVDHRGGSATEKAALHLCDMHARDARKLRDALNLLHVESREIHKENGRLQAELDVAKQHAEHGPASSALRTELEQTKEDRRAAMKSAGHYLPVEALSCPQEAIEILGTVVEKLEARIEKLGEERGDPRTIFEATQDALWALVDRAEETGQCRICGAGEDRAGHELNCPVPKAKKLLPDESSTKDGGDTPF